MSVPPFGISLRLHQWSAGKYLTASEVGAWFVQLADFYGKNTPTMINVDLSCDVTKREIGKKYTQSALKYVVTQHQHSTGLNTNSFLNQCVPVGTWLQAGQLESQSQVRPRAYYSTWPLYTGLSCFCFSLLNPTTTPRMSLLSWHLESNYHPFLWKARELRKQNLHRSLPNGSSGDITFSFFFLCFGLFSKSSHYPENWTGKGGEITSSAKIGSSFSRTLVLTFREHKSPGKLVKNAASQPPPASDSVGLSGTGKLHLKKITQEILMLEFESGPTAKSFVQLQCWEGKIPHKTTLTSDPSCTFSEVLKTTISFDNS